MTDSLRNDRRDPRIARWWHRCWRCKEVARGLRWRGGASIGCVSWEHPNGCEYRP